MAGLTGKTISTSYKSLLRVDNDADGVGSTQLDITDGEGTKTCLKVCDDFLRIEPQDDNTVGTLTVRNNSGSMILAVDTSNNVVKVNSGQEIANTQYAYFGIGGAGITSSNTAGYHYPLAFGGSIGVGSGAALFDQLSIFGNATDPATSVTTADATDQRASSLIGYMMYVPDNIYIDAVLSIEGADAATGDTTRFHLMSYTFNSGSTSCLTSGAVVAYSDPTTNAGSEQVYKSTWNINSDNASVTGGKVLICTFESDSVNSDFAYQAIIKYHLV